MKTKKQIARSEKINRLISEYNKLNEDGGSRTKIWDELEDIFEWSRQHIMSILKKEGVLQPVKNVKQKKRRKKNERRVVA